MSIFSKIGHAFNPKTVGYLLGGIPGLAAGAVFDQKRGQYRSNRDYINRAYDSASQRQRVKEGDVRQGTAEELAARGILANGAVPPSSRIANAMNSGPSAGGTGAIAPSTTLGGRAQAENNREFALERSDLENAHNQSLRENKVDYIGNLVNEGVGAASRAVSLGSALGGGAGDSVRTTTPAGWSPSVAQQGVLDAVDARGLPGVQYAPPSGIRNAMSVDNPDNWFGGVHGLRPLSAPGSSWNTKQTISAPGASNEDFHI